MKKIRNIVLSLGLISTLNASDDKCKNIENTMGATGIIIAQSAIIGGPIGVAYGAGLLYYINKVKDECRESAKWLTTTVSKKEIPVIVPIEKEIGLSKIKPIIEKEKKEVFVNKNYIFKTSVANFDFNSTFVKNFKDLELDYSKIATIRIYGHTDHVGSNEYNFKLGLNRARSFKKYLQENVDLPKDILIATGSYGETKPENYKTDSSQRRISLEIVLKNN